MYLYNTFTFKQQMTGEEVSFLGENIAFKKRCYISSIYPLYHFLFFNFNVTRTQLLLGWCDWQKLTEQLFMVHLEWFSGFSFTQLYCTCYRQVWMPGYLQIGPASEVVDCHYKDSTVFLTLFLVGLMGFFVKNQPRKFNG